MAEENAIGWCILELMGHRKMGGYVKPVEIAGEGFLRIDVPDVTAKNENGPFTATQFYHPKSVYGITPTTMDIAVRTAVGCRVEPVSRWELPPAKEPESRPPDPYPVDDDDEPGPPFL